MSEEQRIIDVKNLLLAQVESHLVSALFTDDVIRRHLHQNDNDASITATILLRDIGMGGDDELPGSIVGEIGGGGGGGGLFGGGNGGGGGGSGGGGGLFGGGNGGGGGGFGGSFGSGAARAGGHGGRAPSRGRPPPRGYSSPYSRAPTYSPGDTPAMYVPPPYRGEWDIGRHEGRRGGHGGRRGGGGHGGRHNRAPRPSRVSRKRTVRRNAQVDREEAQRVLQEVKQAVGLEVLENSEATVANAGASPVFFCCGDSLRFPDGDIDKRRVERIKDKVNADDRCWGVTELSVENTKDFYAEIVIERVDSGRVQHQGSRSSRDPRLFGGSDGPRSSISTQIGVTTGLGELDSSREFSKRSSTRSTFMFDGRGITFNGDGIGPHESEENGLDSLQVGDRVGVLIDRNDHFVSFFINGQEHSRGQKPFPEESRGKPAQFVVELRGRILAASMTSATQPMTQDELEAGTLVGAVKSTQGGPAAMMELLTSAIETAKTTRKRDFLELDHVHRRCPLHYLCGNPKSTPEMLRALIEEEPRALLVVDKNGMTPFSCLLERATLFQKNDLVVINNLFNSVEYNGSVAKVVRVDQNGDTIDVMLLKSFPEEGSCCILADDYREHADAGQGPMKPGEVYVIESSRASGSQVNVNGWSYSVQALRPADAEGGEIVGFHSRNVFHKDPISVTLDHVKTLFESGKDHANEATWLPGRAGEYPLVTAERACSSPDIVAFLREKYAEGVWCGGPDLKGTTPIPSFHLFLHLNMSQKTPEQYQWDLVDTLTEIGKGTNSFLRKSAIYGLPFRPNEVRQTCVNNTSCVFLLHTGIAYRVNLSVLKASDKSGEMIPSKESFELEKVQRHLLDKQKELERARSKLENAKSAEHPYSEDSVDLLVGISEKPREDVINVLKRLNLPGQEKMETAMNILLGTSPMRGNYYDGDDVTRYERESSDLMSTVESIQCKYDDLRKRVGATVCAVAETLLHVSHLEKWERAECKFTQVAMSQSELLALGEDGKLYSWSTKEEHPKAPQLWPGQLITGVVASKTRISVLTESGKVATFVDTLLRPGIDVLEPPADGLVYDNILGKALEHPAMLIGDEKVSKFTVTEFGTIAATTTGHVYFWGFSPPQVQFSQKNERHDSGSHEVNIGKDVKIFVKKMKQFMKRKNMTGAGRSVMMALKDSKRDVVEKLRLLCGGRKVETIIESSFRELQEKYDKSRSDCAAEKTPNSTAEEIAALKIGENVLVRSEKVVPEYPRNSRVIVEVNGIYRIGHLQSSLKLQPKLGSSIIVRFTDTKGMDEHISCRVQDVRFLDSEVNTAEEVTLLTFDEARKIAVVRKLSSKTEKEIGEKDSIKVVDLKSVSPKSTTVSVVPNGILETPICIFDRSDIFVGDQVEISDIRGVGWNVSMNMFDPRHGDVMHQWDVNLSNARWSMRPKCCISEANTPLPNQCMAEGLCVDVDPAGSFLTPSITGLPMVACLAASSVSVPYTPIFQKRSKDESSKGTLFLIGFDSPPGGEAGIAGRTELHNSILESASRFATLLEETPAELMKKMIAVRDRNGETPFFTALKYKDVQSALSLLRKATSLSVVKEACVRSDIHGCSPLHALFGLANTDEAFKIIPGKLCNEDLLPEFFETVATSADAAQLLHACNFSGQTVLESLVSNKDGDPFQWVTLLKVFLQTNGVLKSTLDACRDESSNCKLDHFVYNLFEFSMRQPFANDLAKWIGAWIQSSLNTEHLKSTSMALMMSLCRLYCTLYSTGGASDDQFCRTPNFFSTVFAIVPGITTEILAGIACKVSKVVCVGLPLSILPPGKEELVKEHGRTAGITSSDKKGTIRSLSPSAVAFTDTDGDAILYTLDDDGKLKKYVDGKFARVVTDFTYHAQSGSLRDRHGDEPDSQESTIPAEVREETIANLRILAAAAGVVDNSNKRNEENSKFSAGSKVKLAKNYADIGDAADGPMEPDKVYTVSRSMSDLGVTVLDWMYSPAALVHAEEVAGGVRAEAANPKLQRAHIYRRCVQTIALLSDREATPSVPFSESLGQAEKLLHSSWMHVFDCCNACELGLKCTDNSKVLEQGAAANYLLAAHGVSMPDVAQYEYVAVMLDAIIALIQAVRVNQGSNDAPRLVRNFSYQYTDIQDTQTRLRVNEFMKAYGNVPMDDEVDDDFPMFECEPLFESSTHQALHRWRNTIKFFGRNYNLTGSLFSLLAPFEKKETRFRSAMAEKVRECRRGKKIIKLTVNNTSCACDQLFEVLRSTRDSTETCETGTVSMDIDEKSSFGGGEGKGPVRETFNASATDLKAGRGLAAGLLELSPDPGSPEAGDDWWKTKPFKRVVVCCHDESRNQLGTVNIKERLDRFRCIGNMMGLCLLHGGSTYELRFPVYFCRHVYKYLLGRKITFDDYVFFDSRDHEVLHTFLHRGHVWENHGGLQWDKSVGYDGEATDVTDEMEGERGLRAYAKAKWMWRMVGSVKAELDALKSGLFDVLSPDVLGDLTAEDLQMLLSGTGAILTIDEFKKEGVVKFEDARSQELKDADPNRVEELKLVFWETLAAMTEQELMEFANYTIASYSHVSNLTVSLRDPAANTASPVFSRTCTKELVLSLGNDKVTSKLLLGYFQFAVKMNAALPFDVV